MMTSNEIFQILVGSPCVIPGVNHRFCLKGHIVVVQTKLDVLSL